ncbi:ferric reductase domain protein transmembrane component domain protein [Leptolyngbya sp. Heron Island J]|uniref:ferric reductase-like transmembrane domain-containing protein n=1 Tax=Leptolyngbya sp. Heron Island J TaxID=1385935 RepID=UPI0003B94626|nr:ferric reductase-like transmembrane domain-containing protein [Leptolyngbya sp. Heron Island J]ESA37088.1 ferric reductase domain protein transmembrane component domain protein [Leptolyngbya sp. Heron Island J]
MRLPLESVPLGNHLGFLALAAYVATLTPTIMRIVFPSIKSHGVVRWLLKERRAVGILAFALAVGHTYFVIRKRNFDFFDFNTYRASAEGLSTLIIFAILTATSNDWSIKRLKKNWKRLHMLTYAAMFLLTWHVINKMAGQWTLVTPIATVSITVITVLFLVRKGTEFQKEISRVRAGSH